MTMTERIRRGADAIFELASAELDRCAVSLRNTGNRLVLRLVGLILAAYGVMGVAGACVLLLTPYIGLAGSLLAVGAVVTGGGAAICAVASGAGRKRASIKSTEARIEIAKANLANALDPPSADRSENAQSHSGSTFKDQVEALVGDPRVLTGAAFAALSILGPGRLLKAATRGAGAASAIAALATALKSSHTKPPIG